MKKMKQFCDLNKSYIKDNLENIIDLVKDPKYICKKCARVSCQEKYLCKSVKIKK